ncbi:MAG: UTP--glucose-1-phosphate uridylyltransferase [Candidatus Berkelbacteria bacterium]
MKIKKVVIPAAGYGTRFLPMTKASPKEMLPVIDKPIIQYVVEEAVAAGIEDIIIVTGSNKRAIEDHFDFNGELETYLEKVGKIKELEEIRQIAKMANFIYIRQKGPYGNGTPILNVESVIGNEPFAVLWGDQFTEAGVPRLKQMVEAFEKYQEPMLSVVKIDDPKLLARYGVPQINAGSDGVHEIIDIVEKPEPGTAPSNLACDGAYILTPDIFQALKEVTPGKGDEIWLVDGINKLKANHKVYAVEIEGGKYHDTGNKLDYLKANIDFALKRDDIKDELKKYLQELDI